jgi:septum formation protein
MKLILASSSPRRAELLRDAGFAFQSLPVQVDETRWPQEKPIQLVLRLAKAKAEAATWRAAPPCFIVSADTEVVLDGDVFGKPIGEEDARAMLRRLSGRTHEVITGLHVLRLPEQEFRNAHETTRVTFAQVSDKEIEDYVASGEPFDKAGAYAIQGRGGRFITRVEGCYFNIVGLPLARLYSILRELGWETPE